MFAARALDELLRGRFVGVKTEANPMSEDGIAVVGVTPEQLARGPAQVLRRIEARYAEAKASGFRPDVSARPRDSWLRMA